MANTYTGDPTSTTRDRVRFELGDTGADGRWWFTDAEVAFLVSSTVSGAVVRPLAAAAKGARTIATRIGLLPVKATTGDNTEDWTGQVKVWLALAAALEARSEREEGYSAPVDAGPADLGVLDRAPYARLGVHDHPHAPGPDIADIASWDLSS